jgi:hypothetical protein
MNGPPGGGARVGLFLGLGVVAAFLIAVLLLQQQRGAPPGEPEPARRATLADQEVPVESASRPVPRVEPRQPLASSTPPWPRQAPGPAGRPPLHPPALGGPELPAGVLNN